MNTEQIDRQELSAAAALDEERRLAAHMRAIAAITPAVAHDLRAPINSMVFNLEVLKETITGSLAGDPNVRERQKRYLRVLREEMTRLHRALEIWLAQTAERSQQEESLDLGELLGELAALLVPPARKRQVEVAWEPPAEPVPVRGVRHLVKEALLLVGLAALDAAGSGTTLALDLEQGDERNSATIACGPREAREARFQPQEPSAHDPAGLDVAAALLAGTGGVLWRLGPAERPAGYELEWPATS